MTKKVEVGSHFALNPSELNRPALYFNTHFPPSEIATISMSHELDSDIQQSTKQNYEILHCILSDSQAQEVGSKNQRTRNILIYNKQNPHPIPHLPLESSFYLF